MGHNHLSIIVIYLIRMTNKHLRDLVIISCKNGICFSMSQHVQDLSSGYAMITG